MSPVRTPSPGAHPLAHDTPLFLGLEFVGSGVIAITLSLGVGSSKHECGLCGTNGLDRSVRAALWTTDSRTPGLVSHFVAAGAAPLLALGAVILPAIGSQHPEYGLYDAIKIVDTIFMTTGVNDFTKTLAARERPAFVYGRQRDTEYANVPTEAYRSFYSGDTAWAFTFAASGATLAYERGYWTAPYAAVGGAALGVATGTLRMVADMHWLTDVLMGAAAGTAVGIGMPLLLHPRQGGARPAVAVTPIVTSDTVAIFARGAF